MIEASMLQATREAASAAQSSADAAWWALAVNGAVVAVAIGTTFFQEWRVSRRVAAERQGLYDGAIDTLRRGKIALDRSAEIFHPAGLIQTNAVRTMTGKVSRARRLIALFVGREVDPKVLILLLQMDDLLAEAEGILAAALIRAVNIDTENAVFNGQLDDKAEAAGRLIDQLR